MEMRDAVERAALVVGRGEIARRQPRQDRPQRLVDRRHLPPARPVQELAHRGGARCASLVTGTSEAISPAVSARVALVLQPSVDMLAQAGDGRERGEVLDVGQVARELVGDRA